MIATRDHIKAVLHDTPQNESEFILVDLLFSYNRKITLGVFYRLPGNDPKPLELSLNELILLSDFNLPEIDWLNNRVLRQSDIYTLTMDVVKDNFLTQLVNEPTRESNILDLVLTTSPDLVNDLVVGEPFSDHNSISFHLRSLLSYIPWHCAFLDSDINHNWACWKDLLFTAVDECIPKRKNRRRFNAPWITKELIVLCKKKKLLYNRARRTNKTAVWEKYRQLNNSVKRLCNTARWSYIEKLALDLHENENPKPFWNFVKSKRRDTNNLISLNVDGSVLTDDSSIAQSMNSCFSSVFTTEDYVNFPIQDCSVEKKLASIDCSVNEVKRHLLKFKTNKSPGPDPIALCILKSCALELSPSIMYMVNKSFTTGLLPDEWRHADITPLHREGSKSSRENYRPISLTSIVGKIGEKDLGVTITRDLSWGNHINITVTKANKILGSIKRSVGTANANVFSMLYKSLVRPILEYAAPVWCPYLVKDIHALENVKRRASRLALNQRYEDRCKLLKWPTLSDHRTFFNL